jgi:molybdate transport system permease protein
MTTASARRVSLVPVATGAGLATLLALLLALPLVALLGRALLVGGVPAAATSAAVIDALALSFGTTAISLLVTVVLGTPLALALARGRVPARRLVETLVDLPIVLPPSVAGLALLLLLGRRGVLGEPLDALGLGVAFTTAAVVLAQVFVSAPFYVRAARSGFALVDRDLEDAARVDGATEMQLLRHVTVPLASAALAGGLVMAWARALGEFGATIMFAGSIRGVTETLPLLVYAEFQHDLDASVAAAAILVLAACLVLVGFRTLAPRVRRDGADTVPL